MDNNQKRRPRRYTVKQAAELMGFSESFVRDLIDKGEIGYIRRQTKSGTAYRIRGRDIEQWEDKNSVCPEVNSNDLSIDLAELQEETIGTLLGQRDVALSESLQAPLMMLTPNGSWNATLQSKLNRLRGKSE